MTHPTPKHSNESLRDGWRRRRHSWRRQVNQQLASKRTRDRCTEICGSMLLAALIASTLSILASAIVTERWDLPLTLWMAVIGTLGSWAVMLPAKFAEGRVEDQAPMRFIQLITGSLVGMAAWGLAEMLILTLPVASEMTSHPREAVFSQLGKFWSTGFTEWPTTNLPIHVAPYLHDYAQ